MAFHITCIGALNLDIIAQYRRSDRGLPLDSWGRDEERRVVERRWWEIFYAYLGDRKIKISPGGSAANTGAALKATDHHVAVNLVGVVGKDPAAVALQNEDLWFGVDMDAVIRVGARTGRAFSYVGRPGQGRRIAITPGANDRFDAARVPERLLRKTNWLHASSFASPTSNRQLAKVLRRARALCGQRLVISLDPGTFLSAHGLTNEAVACLKECDYIFTKTSELISLAKAAESLTEEAARRYAVKELQSLSRQSLKVVVERLPDGYTVYRSDLVEPERVVLSVDAPGPVTVRDDVGSGDVFNAGFIYALYKQLESQQAARLIRSLVRTHLQHMGRDGFMHFSTCAPIVFASHSTKDKPLVREFVDQFRRSEIAFWLDEADIPLGANLKRAVKRGLRQCDFVAVFVTRDSVRSGWVRKEYQWAVKRGLQTVAVALAPTRFPKWLSANLYVDADRDGYAVAARKLREALQKRGRLLAVP